MLAARLHGPRDLRVERVPHPGPPPPGFALIRVKVTGICGSDLHSYLDARIGDTPVTSPLVLGHEFSGVVEAVGDPALDGHHEPLAPGTRVAVDPAQPCGRCEACDQGHPNLCWRLHFCGVYPDGGSLCEWMHMPARSCFPIPDDMDHTTGALLEPLGVAIHAVDLAKIRVGRQRRDHRRGTDRAADPAAGALSSGGQRLRQRPVPLAARARAERSAARPISCRGRRPGPGGRAGDQRAGRGRGDRGRVGRRVGRLRRRRWRGSAAASCWSASLETTGSPCGTRPRAARA